MSNPRGIFLGCSDQTWVELINDSINTGSEFIYISGLPEHLNALHLNSQKTILQNIIDLYSGHLPSGHKLKRASLDSSLLDEYLECEITCRSLADRQDIGYSFSNIEREQFYITALEFWLGIFEQFSPNFLICPATPHTVYDYVAYSIAKKKNIPVLMFYSISVLERVLPFFDYKNVHTVVDETYQSLLKDKQSERELSADLIKYIENHKKSSYEDVMPTYLKERLHQTKPDSSLLVKLKKSKDIKLVMFHLRANLKKINPKKLIAYLNPKAPINYLKFPDKPIQSINGLNGKQWKKYKKRSRKYKRQLNFSYEKKSTPLDKSKKFIYVPLQFQPERTSTPEGGRYTNQILMIKLIAEHLPRDWKIVIKENPSQLLQNTMHGERGRYLYYYDEIMSIPNTQLVPLNTNQLELIDNSQAVATLTGTSGWEALVRNKPALVFGHAWYLGCEGTYKVKTNHDCNAALNQIQQGTEVNPVNVQTFLKALDTHAFKGFLQLKRYKNKKEGIQKNINNIKPIFNNFLQSITQSHKVD